MNFSMNSLAGLVVVVIVFCVWLCVYACLCVSGVLFSYLVFLNFNLL